MERLKQALDRARAERDGATPPPQRAPSAQPSQPPGITYTETRTVQPTVRELSSKRIVSSGKPASEAYNILRTQVLQRLDYRGWNVLGITSPSKGDGKSLTAANLAVSIAREVRHTVMLVDLDLRNPSIHKLFGFKPEFGLYEHLNDGADLSNVLVHPGLNGLVILPGGRPTENSSEMMSSPQMITLVEEVKARYESRVVLFDLPPMLSSDDALAFSPFVDAVLLVLRDSYTQKRDLERAVELLGDTPIVGSVLNDADAQHQRYY